MQPLIIAKYTLIEGYKRSLILLFLVGVVVCFAVAAYTASLALVEKQATLAAFYAAGARMMAALVSGVYLILTETRNLERENALIWLGLPVNRSHYLLQKLLAYTVYIGLVVLVVVIPLFWMGTAPHIVFRWAAGLCLELLVVISLSLLLCCLFRQALVSLFIFVLVYLFARSALEFYIHSSNIIESGDSPFELALAWFVKLTTFLVPKLEQFVNAGWILHGKVLNADWSQVWQQAAVFSVLLILIAFERLQKRGF